MKKTRNKTQSLLLRNSNNRWKWMAGATAATAAGVTASQANAITINLLDNYIASYGSNLNADLTGDGHPDLTIANSHFGSYGLRYTAGVTLNGVPASGRSHNSGGDPEFIDGSMRLGSQGAGFHWTHYFFPYSYRDRFSGTRSLTGSIAIFFKDLHINGGAPTEGSLELTVSGAEIQLDSFTYNDPSFHAANGTAVPDQGSSLTLLAMGAGGILTLRRWRATQERS